jgi:hypothetical protein
VYDALAAVADEDLLQRILSARLPGGLIADRRA